MGITTLAALKEQLSFTADLGAVDDAMLERKLEAAEAYCERVLGFRFAERFGGSAQEAVPAPLVEAVLQLAAWWYEQRETAGAAVSEVPFGVSDILASYRDWSF